LLAVAALELGLEFHFELTKIDQVPKGKSPPGVPFPRLVLEADNEMTRVVAHFVDREFRFEMKCAERAITTSHRVKFRIDIEDALAGKIDNPQVGIARSLNLAVGRSWKIAAQARSRIE
jgi:hypothetical protein